MGHAHAACRPPALTPMVLRSFQLGVGRLCYQRHTHVHRLHVCVTNGSFADGCQSRCDSSSSSTRCMYQSKTFLIFDLWIIWFAFHVQKRYQQHALKVTATIWRHTVQFHPETHPHPHIYAQSSLKGHQEEKNCIQAPIHWKSFSFLFQSPSLRFYTVNFICIVSHRCFYVIECCHFVYALWM